MNKYAIYHITDVPYVYGKDLNTLTVRVRTAKDDISKVYICYKDRYDWTNSFDKKEMKKAYSTDLFDFYTVDISVDRNRYRYYFKLEDYENNIAFLDERGIRQEGTKIKEATAFQFPYIAKGDLYQEEKWLQESVAYQIFVDRFCNGDESINPKNVKPWGSKVTRYNMFGGDLKGIINKLDYLNGLGVNLLYLTPIFKSSSNHKYNTSDYFAIDPQFGTLEDAKTLVDECHKRNMRIVFDAVFNHSGDDLFAFKDVIKNGERSKYKDWYLIDSLPIDKEKINYYTFANEIRNMPKFNISNKEVTEYLLDVGEYWVKNIGIDGWRLDVCDEVDHVFWRKFRERIKSVKSDAILIGEIMHEATSFLKGDQLDSIMNYPFKGAMIDFFAKRAITAEMFSNILTQNTSIYMESITRQLWNLIGSHDTQRFLTECGNDCSRMKLAIAFQFTYLGVPYIYYGDEVGLDGGEEPQSRKCMIWDENKQNKELLSLYQKLILIRKENKELIYGEYIPLYFKENVLVFKRKLGKEEVYVFINNSEEVKNVDTICKGQYLDLYLGNTVTLNGNIELKSMEFRILKVVL